MNEFEKDFIPPSIEKLGEPITIGRFKYYSLHVIAITTNTPARHLIAYCRANCLSGRKIGLLYLVPEDIAA